jgi:UDP-glucose 4-epimerase
MDIERTVLIVGGAGFIGSLVNKMLFQNGCKTIVLDNLSRGSRAAVQYGHFIEGDIADSELLDTLFKTYKIDAVMHFAAFIDVGESISHPGTYYFNNVSNTLNLLRMMVKHSINVFIFSSSAAIFGLPQQTSITEDHPKNPINPYGRSKLMVEEILKDFDHAYGLKYSCLRYFNAAGGDPYNEIKNYKSRESNLIPAALRSLKQPKDSITIFGTDYPSPDGTCIRDYVHIYDLGTAHITAMEHLMQGGDSSCYNLGNGQGFTVRQVLNSIEKVTQKRLNIIEGERRPGDPAVLVADSLKAKKELSWKPQFNSLEIMISHAWQALN